MAKKAAKTHPRLSVTLSPGQSPGDFPASEQAKASTPAPESATFPVSAIARAQHPRTSAWAGLSEAGQILAEAEAHKGAPLSREELRALQVLHLDAYDPDWSFQLRGISTDWMNGWEHAFALASQQMERSQYREPLYGIGLFGCVGKARPAGATANASRTTVRFHNATLQVADPEAFFQGTWEGQMTALDAQGICQALAAAVGDADAHTGEAAASLTAAYCFDEVLDVLYEAGNHALDYVVGYLFGLCEGLLCGRTNPPARIQGEHASASIEVARNT